MRTVILSGASGSGKTTIAEVIETRLSGLADVLFFDRIGVPSEEAMRAGWGSGEEWQKAMTREWVARIAAMPDRGVPVLFEGQMRLSFVRDALCSVNLSDAHVVLVDCDDETRGRRLQNDRGQPELATLRMMNWARFLRSEAEAGGYEILDTTNIPLAVCVETVCQRLGIETDWSGAAEPHANRGDANLRSGS